MGLGWGPDGAEWVGLIRLGWLAFGVSVASGRSEAGSEAKWFGRLLDEFGCLREKGGPADGRVV